MKISNHAVTMKFREDVLSDLGCVLDEFEEVGATTLKYARPLLDLNFLPLTDDSLNLKSKESIKQIKNIVEVVKQVVSRAFGEQRIPEYIRGDDYNIEAVADKIAARREEAHHKIQKDRNDEMKL